VGALVMWIILGDVSEMLSEMGSIVQGRAAHLSHCCLTYRCLVSIAHLRLMV